jgi:hypothetical protein
VAAPCLILGLAAPFISAADSRITRLNNRRSKLAPLPFNLCLSFNQEKFICDKILGHFCTFCVNHDVPKDAADRTTCVTKKGVKRAERGMLLPGLHFTGA